MIVSDILEIHHYDLCNVIDILSKYERKEWNKYKLNNNIKPIGLLLWFLDFADNRAEAMGCYAQVVYHLLVHLICRGLF